MSSLLGSIFGASAENDDSTDNLFKSKSLPDRPQHKALPPLPPRKPVEEEEEEETKEEPPKKKRKRKQSAETENEASVEAAEPLNEETETVDETEEAKDDNDTKNDRTIFVGNLPLNTTRKSLAALFKECGKIESTRLRSVAAAGVKLPPERAGDQNLMKKVCANTAKVAADVKTTAQGYVMFSSEESVPKALELNNTVVNGVCLRVDHASPTMDASRTVFVGNLPYKAEEASLQEYFGKECGFAQNDIEGVRIVRDKETMQCKGFGYVLFQNKSMVATALDRMSKTRKQYLKRTLRVQVCGKRFKKKTSQNNKRSFEGKRAETGAAKRISSNSKKRRARGNSITKKNTPHKASGVSKRAAAQAKEGKRVKQIQKRISKGMGKTRR